jgi:hypothetical protein
MTLSSSLSATWCATSSPRWRAGGTVTFAAVRARRLGLSVGIVTRRGGHRHCRGAPFAEVVQRPSAVTTSFENVYDGGRRRQRVPRRPDRRDVPEAWRARRSCSWGRCSAKSPRIWRASSNQTRSSASPRRGGALTTMKAAWCRVRGRHLLGWRGRRLWVGRAHRRSGWQSTGGYARCRWWQSRAGAAHARTPTDGGDGWMRSQRRKSIPRRRRHVRHGVPARLRRRRNRRGSAVRRAQRRASVGGIGAAAIRRVRRSNRLEQYLGGAR